MFPSIAQSRIRRRLLLLFGLVAASLALGAGPAFASTYTIVPGGASVRAIMDTNGENATLTFNGTAGQRVSLNMTAVTIGTSQCCSAKVSIQKPDATNLVAPTFEGLRGGFFDTKTLPVTGKYKILVDPQGTATGRMTLTLYDVPADANPAIAADGNLVTATTTVPGQNMKLPFTGSLGQKVSLAIAANSIGAAATTGLTVTILKPDGTALFTAVPMGTSGGYVDTKTLPAAGAYSVFVNPGSTNVGSVGVTLYNVVDATATLTLGATSSLSTTTPGQNFTPTFTGTAGQRISVAIGNVAVGAPSCCNLKVSLLKPDGTALTTPVSMGVNGGLLEPATLPVAGVYTVLVDPQKTDVGSVDVTAYDVPADFSTTISANGTPVTLTTTAAGQNAKATFTGTLNQRVSLVLSNVTIGSSAFTGAKVTILKPGGTVALFTAVSFGTNGTFIDVKTLPVAGTYTVLVDPQGTASGSADVALYTVPADVSQAITANGAALTFSNTTPGQNLKATFTGSLNQRISLSLSNVTMSSNCCTGVRVSILTPSGGLLAPAFSLGTNGSFMEPKTLSAAGAYKIVVDPQADAVGSITLNLYTVPADFSSAIAAGGSGVTVPLNTPGQNGKLTFSGTAGQRVSLNVSGVTFTGSPCCQIKFVKPGGTLLSLIPDQFGAAGTFIEPKTLPLTGTYTILVDPTGTATGSATLNLYSVPADPTYAITVGGSQAISIAASAPGQNVKLTFTGSASQTVTVALSNVTIGSSSCCSVAVYVKTAGGATVANSVLGTDGGNFQAVLPSAGTYTILVDPQSNATGGATVGLS